MTRQHLTAIFRVVAQAVPIDGLRALRKALAEDSPRVIQGETVKPLPTLANAEEDCARACVLGFAVWKGFRLLSVAYVARWFGHICRTIDAARPGDAARLVHWVDFTPRERMRAELVAVLDVVLAEAAAEDGKGADHAGRAALAAV